MKQLLTITLTLCFFTVFSQNKLSDKIYFGGGGGISAGTDFTNISISPQVGYKVTNQYIVGIGVTYQYVKIKSIDKSLTNYGWSVFNRYNVTQQFFAYGEFERLTFQYFTDAPIYEDTDRLGYNSLLLGGGFSNQLGGSAAFSTMVLYNVLYSEGEPGPYRSPWVIRAGIGVGLF